MLILRLPQVRVREPRNRGLNAFHLGGDDGENLYKCAERLWEGVVYTSNSRFRLAAASAYFRSH